MQDFGVQHLLALLAVGGVVVVLVVLSSRKLHAMDDRDADAFKQRLAPALMIPRTLLLVAAVAGVVLVGTGLAKGELSLTGLGAGVVLSTAAAFGLIRRWSN